MTVSRFSRWHLHAWIWSLVAYLCAWAISMWAAYRIPSGGVRTVLVLLPIAAGFVIYAVSCLLYLASDEYIRLRILIAAAISALLMSAFVLVFTYLTLVGVRSPPLYWVHNIGWGAFVVQMLRLKYSTR